MLELSNFRNPSESQTKKGYKKARSKNTFDKAAKKTKSSTKRSIILLIFSTELTKSKSLLKFINQLKVLLGLSINFKVIRIFIRK